MDESRRPGGTTGCTATRTAPSRQDQNDLLGANQWGISRTSQRSIVTFLEVQSWHNDGM